MPAIEHPGFEFDYDVQEELKAIRRHQLHRGIPERQHDNLLIASWNLSNLGDVAQQRSTSDLALMAEILRPFDLIAVQEVKDDFRQFRELVALMGESFDYLITDRAGNDERLAFILNTTRVERLQLAAEITILARERKTARIEDKGKKYDVKFPGFNRNPYVCAFRSGRFTFTLANVHIYYGAASGPRFRRRAAEVFTLARWAHQRVTSKARKTFDHDIILIGDFNVPKLRASDTIARQLRRFGMQPTNHSSYEGSNLSGRAQYDQIAFHPGNTQDKFTGRSGVLDFDKAIFADIWEEYVESSFHDYVRYHISDHRLIWSEWDNSRA